MAEIEIKAPLAGDENSKQSFFKRVFLRPFSNRTKIVLAILLLIFGGLFALGIYFFPIDTGGGGVNTSGSGEKPKTEAKLDTACPLNGVYTTKEMAERRPIGVMVENSSDARPQSGLNKADLVYEVVTEGGITRFLAFYQCQDASEIGPVRSSRTYYLDWVEELTAFYAHAGGSPDSLARIVRDGILDLNHSQKYFWRTSSRPAPHNLYTSTEKLIKYAQSKKYDLKNSGFATWSFKDDAASADRPEFFKFKINFSSPAYLVEYLYNQETNDWSRKIAGVTDKDAKSGEEIKVKNVIVQFSQIIPRENEDKNRVDVGTVGSGQAYYFIVGKVFQGTWQKSSTKARTQYLDSNGMAVKFNRGPIWVEVVQVGSKIEY